MAYWKRRAILVDPKTVAKRNESRQGGSCEEPEEERKRKTPEERRKTTPTPRAHPSTCRRPRPWFVKNVAPRGCV